MSSKSQIWGARTNGLSGLKGLLAIMGLEVTTEGIRTGVGTEGESFKFYGLQS